MNEETLKIVCFTLAGVCVMIVVAMTIAWDMPPWHQIKILMERRRTRPVWTVENRIKQLEMWSDQWNELRLAGVDPVWVDGMDMWLENDGRCSHGQLIIRCATCTRPRPDEVPAEYIAPCVCGYITECVIHCGTGHETGRCPGAHGAKVFGREGTDYLRYAVREPGVMYER